MYMVTVKLASFDIQEESKEGLYDAKVEVYLHQSSFDS